MSSPGFPCFLKRCLYATIESNWVAYTVAGHQSRQQIRLRFRLKPSELQMEGKRKLVHPVASTPSNYSSWLARECQERKRSGGRVAEAVFRPFEFLLNTLRYLIRMGERKEHLKGREASKPCYFHNNGNLPDCKGCFFQAM